MTEPWQDAVADFVEELGAILPAQISRHQVSEKLELYSLTPLNADAAQMDIVASRVDVILCAGHGTRFELGPLSEYREEVLCLARSISQGHLTEHVRHGNVDFALQIGDGRVLRGGSIRSIWFRIGAAKVIHYAPYSH